LTHRALSFLVIVPTLAGLVIIETRRAKPTDALDHTQRETAEAAAPAHAFEARRGACHRAQHMPLKLVVARAIGRYPILRRISRQPW